MKYSFTPNHHFPQHGAPGSPLDLTVDFAQNEKMESLVPRQQATRLTRRHGPAHDRQPTVAEEEGVDVTLSQPRDNHHTPGCHGGDHGHQDALCVGW